jgi:hypothetical protein
MSRIRHSVRAMLRGGQDPAVVRYWWTVAALVSCVALAAVGFGLLAVIAVTRDGRYGSPAAVCLLTSALIARAAVPPRR